MFLDNLLKPTPQKRKTIMDSFFIIKSKYKNATYYFTGRGWSNTIKNASWYDNSSFSREMINHLIKFNKKEFNTINGFLCENPEIKDITYSFFTVKKYNESVIKEDEDKRREAERIHCSW